MADQTTTEKDNEMSEHLAHARTPETDRLFDQFCIERWSAQPHPERGRFTADEAREVFAAGLSTGREASRNAINIDVDVTGLDEAKRFARIAGLALSLVQDMNDLSYDALAAIGNDALGSYNRLRDALDGEPSPEIPERRNEPVEDNPADADTSFAISTPDPRFDPAAPIVVNGYEFYPKPSARTLPTGHATGDGPPAYAGPFDRQAVRDTIDAALASGLLDRDVSDRVSTSRVEAKLFANGGPLGGRVSGNTAPEAVKYQKSADAADTLGNPESLARPVRLWREVDALGGVPIAGHSYDEGFCAAIADVLAILERRGFTEHTEPLDRLAEAEELLAAAFRAVAFVNEIATWTDEACVSGVIGKAWLRGLVRQRLGDEGFVLPRTYTAEQARVAAGVISRWAGGPGDTASERAANVGVVVVRVAAALGLTSSGKL